MYEINLCDELKGVDMSLGVCLLFGVLFEFVCFLLVRIL